MSGIKAPHTGLLYSLPMLQHLFTVTRIITSCDPNLIKIGTEVDVANLIVPDPDAMFELDYTELSSATSTSKLNVTLYSNGVLKSVNVEASDETATIAADALSVVANVALASAGAVPVAALADGLPAEAGSDSSATLPACNDLTSSALIELARSNESLKKEAGDVSSVSEEIARLTLVIASTERPSDSLLSRLAVLTETLAQESAQLARIVAARQPFLSQITFTEKLRWPSRSEPRDDSTVSSPVDSIRKRWFRRIGDADLAELVTLHISTEPVSQSGSVPTDTVASARGLFYRVPASAVLSACVSNACSDDGAKLVHQVRIRSPQLGRLAVLPFENRTFQNNRVEMEFDELGAPTTLSFDSKQSALAKAASTAKEFSATLPSIRQQLLMAELDRLKLETAELEQEKLLGAARASLDALGDGLSADELADTEAQITLLEARTRLALAEAALRDAETALAGK